MFNHEINVKPQEVGKLNCNAELPVYCLSAADCVNCDVKFSLYTSQHSDGSREPSSSSSPYQCVDQQGGGGRKVCVANDEDDLRRAVNPFTTDIVYARDEATFNWHYESRCKVPELVFSIGSLYDCDQVSACQPNGVLVYNGTEYVTGGKPIDFDVRAKGECKCNAGFIPIRDDGSRFPRCVESRIGQTNECYGFPSGPVDKSTCVCPLGYVTTWANALGLQAVGYSVHTATLLSTLRTCVQKPCQWDGSVFGGMNWWENDTLGCMCTAEAGWVGVNYKDPLAGAHTGVEGVVYTSCKKVADYMGSDSSYTRGSFHTGFYANYVGPAGEPEMLHVFPSPLAIDAVRNPRKLPFVSIAEEIVELPTDGTPNQITTNWATERIASEDAYSRRPSSGLRPPIITSAERDSHGLRIKRLETVKPGTYAKLCEQPVGTCSSHGWFGMGINDCIDVDQPACAFNSEYRDNGQEMFHDISTGNQPNGIGYCDDNVGGIRSGFRPQKPAENRKLFYSYGANGSVDDWYDKIMAFENTAGAHEKSTHALKHTPAFAADGVVETYVKTTLVCRNRTTMGKVSAGSIVINPARARRSKQPVIKFTHRLPLDHSRAPGWVTAIEAYKGVHEGKLSQIPLV
jgi:hypothetical protein